MSRRIFSLICVTGLLLFSLFVSQVRVQAALPDAGGTRTPTATPIMQYSFSGTVTNAVTGAPVSGAVVHIYQCHSSQSAQATTASNGTYSLTLPAQFFCDSSTLQVVASGYVTQTAWSFSPSSPSNIVVNVALQPAGAATLTPTPTATPTGACIPPTPESLRVSPVTSPTTATSQVITVTLHLGSSVTVTSEAGSFTSNTPTNNVFSVTVALLPNSTNHLRVQGTVNWSPNCSPYTLSTTVDTSGNPLNIVQGNGGSPTNTPTRTPTPTPTVTGGPTCSPVNATITAPFSKDGAGTFCWQSSNLGSYVNSWNLANLTINGVNLTNQYVSAANLPAKINGFWYITYTSSVAWGHFEAK